VHGIAPDALAALERHAWPGNVRELQNVIRGAVALARSGRIEVADLPAALRGGPAAAPEDFFALRARAIDAFERAYLARALQAEGGDARRAARQGGIPRATFYRLMKRHGLRPETYRRDVTRGPAAGS
jgi:transcriptional regulator of acetoin/glycerol metabolism